MGRFVPTKKILDEVNATKFVYLNNCLLRKIAPWLDSGFGSRLGLNLGSESHMLVVVDRGDQFI